MCVLPPLPPSPRTGLAKPETRLIVILKLQQPSGVFAGDRFGEIDTRFLYCAVNALSLLGKLDHLNKEKAVEYIIRCRNYDGGFGNVVGAESHAAQGAVVITYEWDFDRGWDGANLNEKNDSQLLFLL